MTVTHLLVAYKSPTSSQVTNLKGTIRSKADALRLAMSFMAEIQGGRKFEEMVEKFTDDRNGEGKPNTNNDKPGSYTWPTADIREMVPEFEKAARATPVGKFAPEPVETQFGYHILRRDKSGPAPRRDPDQRGGGGGDRRGGDAAQVGGPRPGRGRRAAEVGGAPAPGAPGSLGRRLPHHGDLPA